MSQLVANWKYIAKQLRKVDPDPITGITSLTHEAAKRGDNLAIELDRLRAINAELLEALQYWCPEKEPLINQFDQPSTAHRVAWQKARAAIAKAGAK